MNKQINNATEVLDTINAQVTDEVVLTSKKAKTKKVNTLTTAKNDLVNLWKKETLRAKAIVSFFKSDIAQAKAQKFVNEVNKANNTTLKVANLSPQLVRDYSLPYEVNPTEMNDTKTGLIFDVENRKEFFSPNYILTLLQRKAKFGCVSGAKKNEDSVEAFEKYTKERCEVKLCAMITAQAKAELIDRLLAQHEAKK